MTGDRSGGIASFGVSFGDRGRQGDERDEDSTLRIVVVAEVVAQNDWSTGMRPPPNPIPIDAESFDRVMAQLAPSLAIDVADPFGGSETLRVDLVWRDRKAMRPGEIVEQVPALRALVDARRTVQDVASRKLSADAGRAQLERILPRAGWASALVSEVQHAPPSTRGEPAAAAPRAPSPASNGEPRAGDGGGRSGLDALLDMVDLGTASAPPSAPEPEPSKGLTQEEASRIVAAVARSARQGPPQAPRAVVGTAPQRLERAFRNLLDSILHHPEVHRLEATWRGLRLLVEHCDRRAGVEVDVVCAGPDEVAEALKRLMDAVTRAPADLILIDQVLEPTALDLERLEKWGSLAEALLAPVVVGGTAEMLGVDSLARVARSTSALSTSDDPRAIAVRAVASREAAQWIAVVLNDALVRQPYTASTSRQTDPAYEEDPHDAGAHVFTHGGYVIAALCARSHARVRWPTAITGGRDGVVGNLPVHTIREGGQELAAALEVVPTEDAVREAARAGLTLLTCVPNTDAAVLSRAPVLHRANGGKSAAASTLSDQLFVGRFARAVQQIAGAIPRGTEARAAEDVARIALAELFDRAAPPGPEIVAKVDAAGSSLSVTVRPRRFAGVAVDEVTLGAALG
jgi:type VI secretion system ImpB/VipA family protein